MFPKPFFYSSCLQRQSAALIVPMLLNSIGTYVNFLYKAKEMHSVGIEFKDHFFSKQQKLEK